MFDILPDELISNIADYFEEAIDLFNFKIINHTNNMLIKNQKILKLKIEEYYNKKHNILNRCINNDCYKDTINIFKTNYYPDRYNPRGWTYNHRHQDALNYTTISINYEHYKIYTPYCSECFKNFVLIGDYKKTNKILNCMYIDRVAMHYHPRKHHYV